MPWSNGPGIFHVVFGVFLSWGIWPRKVVIAYPQEAALICPVFPLVELLVIFLDNLWYIYILRSVQLQASVTIIVL